MATNCHQLVHELDVAFQQGHHEHVIRQSTLALDRVDFQMSMLDIRARSWCACGKFENAIDDARHMQQLVPLSPRGYYRQGRIYAQYGYHSKALEIYKNAPAADGDEIDNAIKESTRQLENKIDLINKLPMDIVSYIAPMLIGGDQDYHACLDVSVAWRDRLLKSGKLSYSFNAGHHQHSNVVSKSLLSEGLDQVVRLAQHINTLRIRTHQEPFYSLLDRGCFDSLRGLYLQSLSHFGDLERGYTALKRLNSTLRHLELDIYSPLNDPGRPHDSCLSLEKVLDVCTNLISLKTGHLLMNRNVLSQYPTLRRLELGSRRRLTTDDMELILPAFPLLEHLAIRPITDSRLLSLMHTYCPNLSFLEYNTPLIRDKLPTPSTASKAETAGLRFLYIELNDPSNDLKDVIDITMRHHKTLEHLVINLKENQRYDQLSPLFDATTLTFNKLAHVHFGIREIDGWESPGSHDERLIQEGLRLFATILRQSPNLQTLRLGGEALNPQVLYPSLGHIRHLNKIVIGNHTSVFVDDAIAFGKEDMLQQVLDEHVHQSITSAVHPWSQLKHLKFKCYGLSVSLLESITRLPQLETLNIDISRPLGNDQVDFIKKLANGCPQLSDFTLRTNVIPDLVIYHLSLLKQLRHLTLLVQHHINDAAVLSLSACHQLRTLTIPSVVNRDAIEFLKIALPNLNIVICTLETMEW